MRVVREYGARKPPRPRHQQRQAEPQHGVQGVVHDRLGGGPQGHSRQPQAHADQVRTPMLPCGLWGQAPSTDRPMLDA